MYMILNLSRTRTLIIDSRFNDLHWYLQSPIPSFWNCLYGPHNGITIYVWVVDNSSSCNSHCCWWKTFGLLLFLFLLVYFFVPVVIALVMSRYYGYMGFLVWCRCYWKKKTNLPLMWVCIFFLRFNEKAYQFSQVHMRRHTKICAVCVYSKIN